MYRVLKKFSLFDVSRVRPAVGMATRRRGGVAAWSESVFKILQIFKYNADEHFGICGVRHIHSILGLGITARFPFRIYLYSIDTNHQTFDQVQDHTQNPLFLKYAFELLDLESFPFLL